jgi:diguanylate cyclase (GGDEF)-like protein
LPLKSFKRISIVTRIALAASLSLLLFAVAMLICVKNDIEQAVYSETDARVATAEKTIEKLIRIKGEPTLVAGQLRLGRWLANRDNSLVDEVHNLTGADATLFAIVGGKPMRVTTTIRKADGSGRIVHTELVGPARLAYDAGHGFAGISNVAGRPFLNRYDPLRDKRGRVVGIVYTGIPLTMMRDMVAKAMRTVIIVTAFALLASFALLYIAMRPLRRAFRNAVIMAQGLAGGDVDQQSGIVSNDELGAVSSAFREMIKYQQRMACIADALAGGDFSNEVVPVSERDRLGIAFAHMSGKLNRLVQQLEASAMTDALTQLGNRRAFDARMHGELSRAARHGGQVWLALVDIDNFKAVNDENGHQHGDVVLSKLGAVLRHVRAEDGAYRLGGDEFAVILADCSREDANLALERLREEAQDELFGTTISVGLACSAQGLIDGETLQRQADAALYVCKQRGRNIVVAFDEVQTSGALAQQMNVPAVTRLIAERGLLVAYQPIWDLARGTILGFEALARPFAEYGLSGPQEAFEIAVKIGRAHDLDRVCREAAIAQAADLPPNALLFINVSPETLARDALDGETLAASLSEVGLGVDRIVLEITERYAGSIEPVIAAARELQRFGFKLALDDTGAGNAGLHVDFIKIDGAIVAAGARDMAARGVITALVALARTTNAYVIAEGIEDRSMLESVSASSLDGSVNPNVVGGVQGYLVGRPGTITDALSAAGATEALLRTSRLRLPVRGADIEPAPEAEAALSGRIEP